MLLNLDDANVLDLESFYHNGNRYYIVPKTDVAVPSVTSVIYKGRSFPDTPAMKMARDRGTAVHEVCEDYLRNGKLTEIPDFFTKDSFDKLKAEMDQHLTEVNMIEAPLYSMRLMTAGRADCIGFWDGQKSLIDFKTATNPKRASGIKDYFTQAAAYAYMYNEQLKHCSTRITQLVILISPDNNPTAQIFTEPYDKYYDTMYKKFVTDRQ